VKSASDSSATPSSTSPGSRSTNWSAPRPTGPREKLAIALLGLVALSLFAGCDDSKRRWQESRRSARQWLDVALESDQPDERRRAVEALTDKPEATSDWAILAFDSIARTDVDPTVRVAALRGLRKSAGPRTVPTLVKLLKPGDPPPDVHIAPAVVRWEAALLLRDMARGGQVDASQNNEVIDVLLVRADSDEDRNVRIAALEALGSFRDQRVLAGLILALKERDFAIQSAAETSLRDLTGQSHNYDSDEWAKWLAGTSDPFGAAPAVQVSPPRHKSWWGGTVG